MNAKNILRELKDNLRLVESLNEGKKYVAVANAKLGAEKLVQITRNTYDRIADDYAAVRWEEPHELDKELWRKIIHYANEGINSGKLPVLS